MMCPSAFIWRRIHSLLGLGLVVFVSEHLFINVQAALWLGEDGKGFIRSVNLIHALPALQVIEIVLIGIPILFHTIIGVQRVLSARMNSWPSDGSTPSLPTVHNRGFSWQRLTAVILLVGIALHVVQMRFIRYPVRTHLGNQEVSLVKVSSDPGLASLSKRLYVSLYSAEEISQMQPGSLVKKLSGFHLKKNELVAVSPNPGTAFLLTVRDVLKSPLMDIFYTIFVLAAVFHAGNGFWTFLITWGLILSAVSQKLSARLGLVNMAILALMGLSAIWITFWINLRN